MNDHSRAADQPFAAASDVPGVLPSPEPPGASSEPDPMWCRICDREFGPDVERVSNRRLRCKDCDAIDRALHYYFHPKPTKSRLVVSTPEPVRLKRYGPPGKHGGRRSWGELTSTAKLREIDIPVIRAAVYKGRSIHSLAKQYGVSRRTIYHIVNKTSWKHVA